MKQSEITVPEHVAHIRARNAGKSSAQLKEDRKKVAANKEAATDNAFAAFCLGLELNENKFKAIEAAYSDAVKAIGHTVIETEVEQLVDHKIKMVLIRKYKRATDCAAFYPGVDYSELQALENLNDRNPSAETGMGLEELLQHYNVPERLAELKRCAYNNKAAKLEYDYRITKVIATLHNVTLQTFDALIAERELEETREFMAKTAEWLKPEARKAFGL